MTIAAYILSCCVVYFAWYYRDRAKIRTMTEYEREIAYMPRFWGSLCWPLVGACFGLFIVLYGLSRPFAWLESKIENRP